MTRDKIVPVIVLVVAVMIVPVGTSVGIGVTEGLINGLIAGAMWIGCAVLITIIFAMIKWSANRL